MFFRNQKWIIFLFVITMASSCAPIKKARYFSNFKEVEDFNNPDRIYYIENDYSERIQPGDKLYLTVASGNSDPHAFNQPSGQAIPDIELLSYVVDSEGSIKLPYLNRVKVEGFTLPQAADTLEVRLSQYIYLPAVTIHFSTSRITILGEVNSPGVYEFNRKSINIYEAIAYASDISSFGNRRNISIIRQEGNSIKKKQVDLTNDNILTSYWYNIQPNDIIYVEPLRRKFFGIETFDYGLIFSVITTFMLFFTFFNPAPSN